MNKPAYRMLIVDDEEEIRENLHEFAEFKGFDVLEACNGVEALAVMESSRPDIVISDFKMPEMNGLEMLQEMQRRELCVPVVIMTAYGTMEYAIEAMKAGAWDFIAKPIDLPYLMQVVERVIQRSLLEQKIKEQQQQLDEDLNHAATIQRCLLPNDIVSASYELHYRYQPMIAIGGDYLTLQKFSPHEIAVALYDVSGHGVSAALTANFIHSRLQALLTEHAHPAAVVDQLNQFILNKIGTTYMFATAAVMYLNVEQATLTVTNAGHPEVLIWRQAEERLQTLSSHVPPVGLSRSILGGCNETTLPIQSGDRIIIYTDGFIETNNARNEMLGSLGFQQTVTQHIHLPPADFLRNVYDAVDQFRDGEPDDDLTLLIVDIK